MELLLGLHHAQSRIGWPSLSASEQGIGLFCTEDAQQAEAASGRPRWLEVLAMAAKYFGTRRQAMMAKIAWRNERSTLESVCSIIG
jgi:hypothetical protein